MIKPFPHYQQLDSMDCGPSCLRMIAKFYGHSYSLQNLREKCFITRQGVSMLGISDAAESIGLRTQGVRVSLEQLIEDVPLPCILHWNQNHFVVLYAIKKGNNLSSKEKVTILPAHHVSPFNKMDARQLLSGLYDENFEEYLENKLDKAYAIHYFLNMWSLKKD